MYMYVVVLYVFLLVFMSTGVQNGGAVAASRVTERAGDAEHLLAALA